jgi:hypothetical protein
VWRTRSQLELATVEYIGWFNTIRLHSSLGNTPPSEYEQRHQQQRPELSTERAKTAIAVVENRDVRDWSLRPVVSDHPTNPINKQNLETRSPRNPAQFN